MSAAAQEYQYATYDDLLALPLEVYQLENQRWSLMASLTDDDAVSQVPFDAISFSLESLWA